MSTIPRDVGQLIITKLDLGHATVKESKELAARYGLAIKGRTREQVAREIGRAMEPAHYELAITGIRPDLTAKLIEGLKKSQ